MSRRRKWSTPLWVALSVIAVGVPIVVTMIFGTTSPRSIGGADELVGVWRDDDTGSELRLEADRTAMLDDFVDISILGGPSLSGLDRRGAWTYDPGTVRVALREPIRLSDVITLDPERCGLELCLRYGLDDGPALVFRRQSEG